MIRGVNNKEALDNILQELERISLILIEEYVTAEHIEKRIKASSFSNFLKDRWIERIKKGEMIEGKTAEGAVVKVLFNRAYRSYIYFPEWQKYATQTMEINKTSYKHIGKGLFYNT
ncbi:MAG: hypothetical protein ACFFCZ_30390 [Promethearchaeota archaeon]